MRARAAKNTQLDEEVGDEDDLLTVDYQFGMDLDGAEMQRMSNLEPVPTVVYTPFMAEEEVTGMEDDGPYTTEMREAIIGVRNCLSDTQMAARYNVERLMDYVDSSNT